MRSPILELLPVEIWHAVLTTLSNPTDRKNFARCSKSCYYFAFPILFKGLKLHEGFESASELHMYEDGGFLAPLKPHIRSVSYCSSMRDDIFNHPPFHLRSRFQFPNVTRVSINYPRKFCVDRTIFESVLKSLQALDFYHNIQNLEFHWARSRALYIDDSGRTFEHQVLKTGTIRFPRSLQSLVIRSTLLQDPYYLLPLIYCEKMKKLSLVDPRWPTMNPRWRKTILKFPAIKELTIQLSDSVNRPTEFLAVISKQFPNLESIIITLAVNDGARWINETFYFKYIRRISSLIHIRVELPGNWRTSSIVARFQSKLCKWFRAGRLGRLKLLVLDLPGICLFDRPKTEVGRTKGELVCEVFRDWSGDPVKFEWKLVGGVKLDAREHHEDMKRWEIQQSSQDDENPSEVYSYYYAYEGGGDDYDYDDDDNDDDDDYFSHILSYSARPYDSDDSEENSYNDGENPDVSSAEIWDANEPVNGDYGPKGGG